MQKDSSCVCILSLIASESGSVLRAADICGCPGEDHFCHHDWRKQTIWSSGESVWSLFFFFFASSCLSVDPFTSLTSDTWPHWPAQFYIRTTNHNNSTYVSTFNLKIVAISSAHLCWRNTLGGRRSKVTSAAGRSEECRMEDEEHQHTILTLLHHIYKLLWLFST